MLALGFTEGLGLILVIPVLGGLGIEINPEALGGFASIFTRAAQRWSLAATLSAFVFVVAARALLQRWQTVQHASLQGHVTASLHDRLHRAVTGANWLFITRRRMSDFAQALTVEVDRVGAAVHHLLQLLARSIQTAVYLAFALWLSTAATALVLACGAALAWAVKRKSHASHEAGSRLTQASQQFHAAVSQHLDGLKAIKVHDAEARQAEVFSALSADVRRLYRRSIEIRADASCWFEIGAVLILSALIYAASEGLRMPVAHLLLLSLVFVRTVPRLSSLLQSYHNLNHLVPALGVIEDLEACCLAAAEPRAVAHPAPLFTRSIQLERIRFSYGAAPLLHDLDLTLNAGETVALMGPSGSGKSTIADLLTGLLMPQCGRVLLDGAPATPEAMRAFRGQVGYVAQETFLFHDTIRANLLWARPDSTDEDVREALRRAAALEFIAKLPQGVDTVVGDRGVRLSGGERQRLALARALLRKPALLILDEATSQLDRECERSVMQAIDRLRGSLAILIISHRRSAIAGAETIYLLEHGRIVRAESPAITTGDRRWRTRTADGRLPS